MIDWLDVLLIACGWLTGGLIFALATDRLAVRQWLWQAFIAVDQLVNVLATPFNRGAWGDETLSSRAYRAHRDGKPWGRLLMPVIDILFRWQGPGHCKAAYDKEAARLHSPPETRNSQGA